MSQPGVDQSETDGALGVLPEGGGVAFAIVGVSSSGPIDQPAAYGKVSDVVAAYGAGPLVEAAAYYIANYQRPVLVCRCGDATAGAYVGDPTVTGAGTSVPSEDSSEPNDDYDAYVVFDVGGTVGTNGILYRESLDGGQTMSVQKSLGTATTLTLAGSGVGYDLAAGTILAGQTIAQRTTAPAPNATELGTAIDAVKASKIAWEIMLVATPLDATLFDVPATKIADKRHAWVGNTRLPSAGESEATYLSSLSTAFAAKTSTYAELCAGACDLTSGVNSRKYRRPVSFALAAREAASLEHVNIADPNLGGLPGVSIHDALGMLKHHDESNNPGLDDARFSVLRTWVDFEGIHPNRPRLFCAAGSDFYIMPMRRLLNIIHRTAKRYMARRLNQPIEVSRKTGYVKEQELLEMESGCGAAFAAALAGRKTSARLALSRTDKVLSTRKLTGKYRGLPPAYIELAELDGGWENPANLFSLVA
jgi:hypothetical protein